MSQDRLYSLRKKGNKKKRLSFFILRKTPAVSHPQWLRFPPVTSSMFLHWKNVPGSAFHNTGNRALDVWLRSVIVVDPGRNLTDSLLSLRSHNVPLQAAVKKPKRLNAWRVSSVDLQSLTVTVTAYATHTVYTWHLIATRRTRQDRHADLQAEGRRRVILDILSPTLSSSLSPAQSLPTTRCEVVATVTSGNHVTIRQAFTTS